MTGRPYSTRTVARAIQWLISHRLLMQIRRSHGGRGCGSVYFVRWSFAHRGLRSRQICRNMQTGYRASSIEETQNYSSLRETGEPCRVSPKALRWVKAQLRKAPVISFPDRPQSVLDRLATGLVVAAHRAVKRGELKAGSSLGRFVELVTQALARQDSVDDCFDNDPETPCWNRARAFGWAGKVVRDVLDELEQERGTVGHVYSTAGACADGRKARLRPAEDATGRRTAYLSLSELASSGSLREQGPAPHTGSSAGDRLPDRFELRQQSREGLDRFLAGSECLKLSDVLRSVARHVGAEKGRI